MTETQQVKKLSTGTAWIVTGAVAMAIGLLQLVTAPMVIAAAEGSSTAGSEIAAKVFLVVVFAGFGVWLLVIGLNKRRAHLNQ